MRTAVTPTPAPTGRFILRALLMLSLGAAAAADAAGEAVDNAKPMAGPTTAGSEPADAGAAAALPKQDSAPAPAAGPDRTPEAVAREAGRAIARRGGVARHLSVSQRIDENVHRLAHGLELDAGQQDQLRQILMDQHRMLLALRSGTPGVTSDAAGTTLAIYEQTKARIRSILNEEQKKKYSADVPRGELAPSRADLQHWMDLQAAKRRQGQAEDEMN